jgi:micrococcal nuclease
MKACKIKGRCFIFPYNCHTRTFINEEICMRFKVLFLSVLFFSFNADSILCKVIGISAGNTISILNAPRICKKIHLNGIVCPDPGKPYGQKAKDFTTEACLGKEVRIVTYGKNRGRIMADVYLSEGKMLNQELVRNGLAWQDKMHSSDTTLARLENEAREKKIGLWTGKIR